LLNSANSLLNTELRSLKQNLNWFSSKQTQWLSILSKNKQNKQTPGQHSLTPSSRRATPTRPNFHKEVEVPPAPEAEAEASPETRSPVPPTEKRTTPELTESPEMVATMAVELTTARAETEALVDAELCRASALFSRTAGVLKGETKELGTGIVAGGSIFAHNRHLLIEAKKSLLLTCVFCLVRH